MSKTYSAGIVTAYGAAKRAGYQGTYEDFCRQQAGYAESAAAVEQAKNTAVSAASTATTKAGEAATAATAAQTAKTQTEQSASQALTDIETARTGAISAVQTEGQSQTANATAQALAAAQSATTASTKASEASASATSAGQSATNAAASATSAANAASAAQGVLDSIPEDYSDLSRDVDDLKADLNNIASKTENLFDPSVGVTQGYYSPTGKLNSETLIPAKDTTGSNFYYLYNSAIRVEGGKTYAFPIDYVGRLSTYTGQTTVVDGVAYYNRSGYVNNTNMTNNGDCLLFTPASTISFICLHFWKNTGSIQDYINSFMMVEVDDASTFAFPSEYIPYGYISKVNVSISKITGYDIEGTDTELYNALNGTAKKSLLNLYDNSKSFSDGYYIGTTADIANLVPTGLVSKSGYKTSLQLIPVQRGSKFVVSKAFEGGIGIFNPAGGRSKAISNTEMAVGENCLYYELTTATFPYEKYYIAFSFNANKYSDYLNFVCVLDVDYLPSANVSYGDDYLRDCKVLSKDVVGFADFISDPKSKYAYSEDNFNESYAARVQEAQTPNSLTITFKTDSHTDLSSNSISTENSVANALKTGYVGDYLGQDLIVHGGDLLTTGYTDKTIPLHSLRGYLNRMYKFAKAPLLIAKGNHDDSCYDSKTSVNNYSTDALILPHEWNAIAMQYAKKYAVCPISGNANYCYIDNDRTKIRVFILDTEDFDYHVSNGVAELNSGSTSAFSNEQLNFIANALLFDDKENPSEWAALFISHRPLDTTTTSRKRMGIGDTLIRNHLIMLSIITAYKNGTSYSAQGYGGRNQTEIDSHYFPYNVNVDYTNKGQGEVIAFLFGHTHKCNTSAEVGVDSSALSYGYRYISCGSNSFYTLVFNRDTKKINVFFYASSASNVQLVSDSTEYGEIIGLTSSDLNEYGDWETTWS